MVNELKPFCQTVYDMAISTVKFSGTTDERELENLNIDNAWKMENKLVGIPDNIGLGSKWGVCPDYMHKFEKGIYLINYVRLMSRVVRKGEGVCRHLSSNLYMRLRSKGFYCGLMFLNSDPEAKYYRGPDHVVVLIATQNGDKTEFFVADSRLLQGIFMYIYYKNSEISLKAWQNCMYENQHPEKYHRKKYNLSTMFTPLDFLLVPLDDYLKWNSKFINVKSISVAFNFNDILDFTDKHHVWGNYPMKTGPKTIEDFKSNALKMKKDTTNISIEDVEKEIVKFWPNEYK